MTLKVNECYDIFSPSVMKHLTKRPRTKKSDKNCRLFFFANAVCVCEIVRERDRERERVCVRDSKTGFLLN